MKRTLLAFVSVALIFSLSSCTCSVEKGAVSQVDNSQKLISAKLIKYVDADDNIAGPKHPGELDADFVNRKIKARDDWHKMIDSNQRNIDALKKALE